MLTDIRCIFWKSLNRIARWLNLFWAFNCSVGIKQLNMSRLANPGRWTGRNCEMDSAQLLLGPDFLKDRYTLLGTSLADSPHYALVKTIAEGGCIEDTDYFHRFRSATLDWRLWQFSRCNSSRFVKSFEKSKSDILNDKYAPVIIYKVGKKNYVFDGKHRAAMCLLYGRQVKCIEVDNSVAYRGVFHFLFEMTVKGGKYLKHQHFLNEAIKQ